MTDQTTAKQDEEIILAEGVDDEPVEANRRTYEGHGYTFVFAFATIYAMFHMAALNGVSIKEYIGLDIPFLPRFPLETWNFRIVHVAGALALGFLMFSAVLRSEPVVPR